MFAPMPDCPVCGMQLSRRYTATAVIYNAPDFNSTDTRFERQVGPERAARFRAQRDDVMTRAKAGKLTAYEKALEGI